MRCKVAGPIHNAAEQVDYLPSILLMSMRQTLDLSPRFHSYMKEAHYNTFLQPVKQDTFLPHTPLNARSNQIQTFPFSFSLSRMFPLPLIAYSPSIFEYPYPLNPLLSVVVSLCPSCISTIYLCNRQATALLTHFSI